MPVYPSLYRARANRFTGSHLQTHIPQVFGDTEVSITDFLNDPTTGMGWVMFQGGDPEHPVWLGPLTTSVTTDVTPSGNDEVWIGDTEPDDDAVELWFNTVDQRLYADVDGEWVPTSSSAAGTDEVWVGPTAPADPGIELWIDTDEPSYMTDDMRWFTSWGVIAEITPSSPLLTSTPVVVASLTVTTVVGRRYRAVFNGRAANTSTADSSIIVALLVAGRDLGMPDQYRTINTIANGYGGVLSEWRFDGDGESRVHNVRINPFTGEGATHFQPGASSHFYIEDIGPTAPGPSAVLPASTVVEGMYTPTWTAQGGPPVLGSGGFIVGHYQRIGQWCEANIHIGFGTGVNGSNGYYNFGLPFPAATNVEHIGAAKLYHGVIGWNYLGYCLLNGPTFVAYFPVDNTSNNFQAFRGADGTSAVGTGVPAIAGQYTVVSNGNATFTVRYRVQDGY